VTDPSNPDLVATPASEAGVKAFVVTPFARLARTHVAGTVADAMAAAAFAGSLFFSLPADGARGPVLRYLLITMLPFAVLSPLIGPLVDRLKGGHRFVVLGAAIARAGLAYLLIGQIEEAGTEFFLLALCLLVGQKSYQVGRSALVPSVVRSDRELVEANSKLSLLSGLSSFAGAAPAAAVMTVFGPKWSLGMATIAYLVAAVLAAQLPPSKVATTPAGEAEKIELRGAGIILAGSAMGILRWCVGFLTLLVAFGFRGESGVTWQLGFIGGATVLSQLAGAAAAPKIREHTQEENLLSGSLVIVLVGSLLSVLLDDVIGAALLGASVGFSAAVGKLAFDSILQRDAPDANRGRAFAKFETRFQVMWVVGALIPVWVTFKPIYLGFLGIGGMAFFALASYTIGRMAWAHRSGTRQTAATAAALGIEERFTGVSVEVKGRVADVGRRVVRRRHAGHGDEVHDEEVHGDEAEYDETRYDAEAQPDHEQQGGEAVTEPYDHADEETVAIDADAATRVVVDPDTGEVLSREHLPPPPDEHLLGDDPDSWPEPEWADSPYPWDPPVEKQERRGAFMEDVPTTVDNPYPWTPDPDEHDLTDPEGRPRR